MKLRKIIFTWRWLFVAPFAGAWIEIHHLLIMPQKYTVAPFAGAWIEILHKLADLLTPPSLPSRERGLKFVITLTMITRMIVAPFAGAWIEIA